MKITMPQIAEYIERCRQGDYDSCFLDMLDMEQLLEVIRQLMEVYRNEPNARVRAFFVEAVWQCRQLSAIPFLGEALHDAESVVWKEALNGLVTLASPAALDVLRSARVRHLGRQRDTEEFRNWVDEAIEQAETTSPKNMSSEKT